MTSEERKAKRRERREEKRRKNKEDRSQSLGEYDSIFSYGEIYNAATKSCNGTRWKASVQNFERHKFSNIARLRGRISGVWVPKKTRKFTINERGKMRNISAPAVDDKPIQKILAQNILYPLYSPIIIANSCASLKNKGTSYSQARLKQDLRAHWRKYGMNGYIVLIDFEKFFPTADHSVVLNKHKELMFDEKTRSLADIMPTYETTCGLPLGMEPSQLEMVAFASKLDSFVKCQLRIKGYGVYMDDHYLLISPDVDPNGVIDKFAKKACEFGLSVHRKKTKVIEFGKAFVFCKTKYIIENNGHIITKCNRRSIRAAKRKIKKLAKLYGAGRIQSSDVQSSLNSQFAYLKQFDNGTSIRELKRLFSSSFHFFYSRLTCTK